MATYVEYRFEDGTVLLVEADESDGKPIKAADADGNAILTAQKKFEEAVVSVRRSVTAFREELLQLEPDEIEVTFGIKTVGEAGFFAVCKATAEANYTLRLKWTKPAPPSHEKG